MSFGGRRRRGVRAGVGALAALAVASLAGFTETPVLPATTPEAGAVAAPVAERASSRPNVLVLNVDDMTISDLARMPHVQDLLVDQGTSMTDMVAPTPICVPSRASMLTGEYAHHHGARTISGPHGGFAAFGDRDTLPVWLQRAGYRTIFAGKYLNGYGKDRPRYVPPGWSQWFGSVDPSTYFFYGTTFNRNGTLRRPSGHVSDVVAAHTVASIQNAGRSTRPWFAWVNFVAPHSGGRTESDDPSPGTTTMPAKRHRNTRRHVDLPAAPEMQQAGGSPWDLAQLQYPRREVREMYQQRLEALRSVDEAVAKVMRSLRETGQLGRTHVLFTSDNGYLVGHHNRVGKLMPFDRSLRVPLVVRGPGIARGRRLATTTTVVDLPVTIAALTGATPAADVDGVDMSPYWRSSTTYDRPVPIAGWVVNDGTRQLYSGLRFGRYTYAVTSRGTEALFDRSLDPGELQNFVGSPDHAVVLAELRTLSEQYATCAGATCPQEETFVPRI